MRVKVGDKWVTALIDLGVTHSLMNTKLITKSMKVNDCNVKITNPLNKLATQCRMLVETTMEFMSKHNELGCNMKFYCIEMAHEVVLGMDSLRNKVFLWCLWCIDDETEMEDWVEELFDQIVPHSNLLSLFHRLRLRRHPGYHLDCF
ncbi:hypothetical protein RB653_006848 [Dictyostelium firmibasis]|uniref:Uncharacterized protein n=1 Tax=Dictyostelium firmibasis TaxID=79012 RepID=A0AAN7TME8_9MYCE